MIVLNLIRENPWGVDSIGVSRSMGSLAFKGQKRVFHNMPGNVILLEDEL